MSLPSEVEEWKEEAEVKDVGVDERVDERVAHSDSADLEEASLTEVPQGCQVGVISATFLIVNRVLGTGVFSTTSTILSESGSVGMSLTYWVIREHVGGLAPAIGLAFLAVGILYWAVWYVALSLAGHYRLETRNVTSDGTVRVVWEKHPRTEQGSSH